MKTIKFWFICAILVLLMGGCSKETKDASKYHMFYINKSETKIVEESYTPKSSESQALVAEFLAKLDENPENASYKKAKPDSVKLLNYSVEEKQVFLTFDTSYSEMSNIEEILFRSAMVKMLTQIPDIEFVSFYINDKPLMDANGNVIGIMTADNFIENTSDAINTYERANLTLYYANDTGDKLIETSVDVIYRGSRSMEKLILEQLIKGPATDKVHPTIPPETKLLGVSIKDGICYVNFDEGFLNQTYELTESVPVYSVVNSLLELPNISKVQIMINGETDITYREAIHFDTLFERNVDIVEKDAIVTTGEENIINE